MSYLPTLEVPDLSSQTWKDIFDLYDRNFQLILNTLSSLNNKFVIETHTGLTSDTITLTNSYDLGCNSLAVYCNGIRQWPGESFSEVTNTSFKLSFTPKTTDIIKVIIIKVLNVDNNPSGVLASLQSTLVTLNSKLKEINDDITAIDNKMSYIQNYETLNNAFTELKTSTDTSISSMKELINEQYSTDHMMTENSIDAVINGTYTG